MIWFTADTHFSHKAAITKIGRVQFTTVEEMDSRMIENWNSCVGKQDTVYHLGDVSFASSSRTVEILTSLNGTIHLIRGNHDRRMKALARARFETVTDYHELKVGQQLIVLCHYPFSTWRNSHYGSWSLHGHSHGSSPILGKRLDVGVDVHSLYPIPFDRIQEIMDNRTIHLDDYHGKGEPNEVDDI